MENLDQDPAVLVSEERARLFAPIQDRLELLISESNIHKPSNLDKLLLMIKSVINPGWSLKYLTLWTKEVSKSGWILVKILVVFPPPATGFTKIQNFFLLICFILTKKYIFILFITKPIRFILLGKT